jgi:hypothetical protein
LPPPVLAERLIAIVCEIACDFAHRGLVVTRIKQIPCKAPGSLEMIRPRLLPLAPARQWRSNLVSAHFLSETGISRVPAGDFRDLDGLWAHCATRRLSRMQESPPIAGLSRLIGRSDGMPGLRGWRHSADRARLQANSLLTGNLTGNSAISEVQKPISRQEALVPQRLSRNSLRKLTGKKIWITGIEKPRTGNFAGRKVTIAVSYFSCPSFLLRWG